MDVERHLREDPRNPEHRGWCVHKTCRREATAILANTDFLCDGEGTCEEHEQWFAEAGYTIRPLANCGRCGTTIVEHPDQGNGPWWGQPREYDYDPCSDENGLPTAHVPEW